MFSWITDHVEAAITFFGAILLNATVLAMGYGRLSRRLEDVERCQQQCPELFVRKDVLQPQLENITKALDEVKQDVKTLLRGTA
jgi:Tfp pilus assembly protein PilO